MQLSPCDELKHIVKHYLFINNDNEKHLHYRFFSDGNPGIVFHFNAPLIQDNYTNTSKQEQPRSFIYGQITHYNNITLSGRLSMLVVVLQPYGANALLGTAASELNDTVIKLSDVFKQQAADLEEQLLSTVSIMQSISLVERFLIKRVAAMNSVNELLKEVVKVINNNHGLISLQSVISSLPVTERQLERLFNRYIGTPPKKFTDTVRFQFFLKSLQNSSPAKGLNEIVYDYGFYDQAHLNNYFKKNTGLTPMQYKAGYNPAVINFMPIN
jgi:AraC-like DNA-binding protein